jgi:hypothetical protein
VAALVTLFTACGLDENGGRGEFTDGGAGTAGAHAIGKGTCFPGAKACPDAKGELVCLSTGDPKTGCQTSTSCAPCELPHATAACAEKIGCAVGTCDSDWNDCDQDPSDGCEASLGKDTSHCGNCATNCITANGPGWLCDKGVCITNQCQPSTTANCDADPANGCEVDLTSDPNNCGFCGNTCKLPHATSGCAATPSGNPLAACVVVQCDSGWANCDGNDANGCESSAGTDPSTCGGCGKKCSDTNGVPGCVNGVCGILCNPGWGNCDGNADNGCETDLSSHVSHCGGCDQPCSAANGTPNCVAGKCTTGGCNTGFADCDGNTANGCETDTLNDPAHCGSCGGVCPAVASGSPACVGGACSVACAPGFASCGTTTTCFDTVNDPAHCGAQCATCPGPATGGGAPACVGGTCQVNCAAGLTACGGSCVDLQNSQNNCGACGKTCSTPTGGTVTCAGGQCQATCTPPLTPCNGSCVNTLYDGNNCGGCNQHCKFLANCVSGTCQCPSSLKECSGGCAQCCSNSDCNKYCCWGICCA